MTVKVRCPNPDCRAPTQVTRRNLGKQGRCQQCGKTFTLVASRQKSREHAQSVGPKLEATTSSETTFGRFEVKKRLGAGAFGAVYLAYDPQLERDVALKVPHVERIKNPQFVKRFLNEAKAVARLQHPYIVPVFDASGSGKQLFIASAFIVGTTLEEHLGRETFDFRETAQIVMCLAEALTYAHKQGIVHRDVKPANIMLDEQGEPHLMDFGLARLETSSEKLTHDGSILGTPAYMAPEQARGATDEVGALSDQYGLGATLYEMLTGDLPFRGPTEVVIFNVIHEDPPAPRDIRKTIPDDLNTICLKAMAKQPRERYTSCNEFAVDLRRWLDDEPIAARPLNRFQRLIRWSKREPLVAGLTIAVFVVTLLGFVGVSAQWRKARREALIASNLNERLEERQLELKSTNQAKERQRVEAIRQRDLALHNSYAAMIGLAFVEANKRDSGTTPIKKALQDYLARSAPPDLHRQLSGWEWHYLNSANKKPVSQFVIPKKKPPIPSPGIQYIALPSPGQIEIRDARTGKTVNRLTGVDNQISWSSDARKIVAVDRDDSRRLKIFDVLTGRLLREFSIATGDPKWIYWSPDQRLLLTRYTDSVSVWSAIDGALVRSISTSKSTRTATWHPDGSKIAVSFTGDKGPRLERVAIYDVQTGDELKSISGSDFAATMAWSSDGKYFAYCDRYVSPSNTCVLETAGWQTLAKLTGGGHYLHWHPQKPWLATISGSYSNSLRIHVIPKMAEYRFQFLSNLTDIRWSHDGNQLLTISGAASVSTTRTFEVWDDTATHSHILKLRADDTKAKGIFSWSPDGQRFAVVGKRSEITVYEVSNYEPTTKLQLDLQEPVWSSWSADGQTFAVATSGQILILDGQTFQQQRTLEITDGELTCATWSAGTNRIAFGSSMGTIDIWDTQSSNVRQLLSGDGEAISDIDADKTGRLAIGDRGGTVRIVPDVGQGKIITLAQDLGRIQSVSIDPDGQRLASLNSNGVITLWNLTDGEKLLHWPAHESGASELDWSSDGSRLASAGGSSNSVRIWDPNVGLELMRFEDLNPVWWCRWSPSGRRLAIGFIQDKIEIIASSD